MTLDTGPTAHEAPGGADDRLLPWGKVRDITGLSRTTAWRRQKAGDFPLAVQISPGRVGWWESELTAWKASRAPRKTAARAEPTEPPRTPRPPSAAAPEGTASLARTVGQAPKPTTTRGRVRSGCEGQIAFEF